MNVEALRDALRCSTFLSDEGLRIAISFSNREAAAQALGALAEIAREEFELAQEYGSDHLL